MTLRKNWVKYGLIISLSGAYNAQTHAATAIDNLAQNEDVSKVVSFEKAPVVFSSESAVPKENSHMMTIEAESQPIQILELSLSNPDNQVKHQEEKRKPKISHKILKYKNFFEKIDEKPLTPTLKKHHFVISDKIAKAIEKFKALNEEQQEQKNKDRMALLLKKRLYDAVCEGDYIKFLGALNNTSGIDMQHVYENGLTLCEHIWEQNQMDMLLQVLSPKSNKARFHNKFSEYLACCQENHEIEFDPTYIDRKINIDLNAKIKDDKTFLTYIATTQRKLFKKRCCEYPQQIKTIAWRAFCAAIETGDVEEANNLYEYYGIDLGIQENFDLFMQKAIEKKDLAAVQFFCGLGKMYGFSVNRSFDYNGRTNITWLTYAVFHDCRDIVQYLLEQGAIPTHQPVFSYQENTALLTAIAHDRKEIMRMLIDAGANIHPIVNITDVDYLPLIFAIDINNVNAVDYLIRNTDFSQWNKGQRDLLYDRLTGSEQNVYDLESVFHLLDILAKSNQDDTRTATDIRTATTAPES